MSLHTRALRFGVLLCILGLLTFMCVDLVDPHTMTMTGTCGPFFGRSWWLGLILVVGLSYGLAAADKLRRERANTKDDGAA